LKSFEAKPNVKHVRALSASSEEEELMVIGKEEKQIR